MRITSSKNDSPPLKRLLFFLKPYKLWVFVKLVTTIVNAANDIFLVYLISLLVNTSLSGDLEELTNIIYLMIVFVVIGIIVSYLETYASGRFSALTIRDLKNTLSTHIDKLPISYIESLHSGDFLSRITINMTKLENFLKNDLIGIIFHIFRISICILLLFLINWRLTLACMVLIPLLAILTIRISRPMDHNSSNLQQSYSKLNNIVQDVINGVYMIKAYNLNRLLFDRYAMANNQVLDNSLIIEKRKAFLDSAGILVRMSPFLLFFLYGGYLVINGDFTAGGFVAFAQLMNYLVQGMQIIPSQIGNFKIAKGVSAHLFELLDKPTERKGGMSISAISPDIPILAFERVSFSYNSDKQVFNDLSFTLPHGKTLAFVGSSGAGKSTIFKLLLGFYDYQEGEIRLLDKPLTDWNIDSARSLFSWVSQDTYLFSDSIKENITAGRKQEDQEEIERVAKMANIHDFILNLPEQYNTQVSENGINLSGGQRQRLSLARALWKDAPIFLLDEPTSALDFESEQVIQDSINLLKQKKTILVIAHRLSTILAADKVIVLDDGRIVESGTHTELLKNDGVYKRLYEKQLKNLSAPQLMEMGVVR